jgi:hypothetical protein
MSNTIKINFITYNNQYGLTNDLIIFGKLLQKHFDKKIDIKIIDYFTFKAPRADINIFFETISNILTQYASTNILIPNQQWFYKCWTPYLSSFDYVLVKTEYAQEIFKKLVGEDKVNMIKNIGWKSIDRHTQDVKKDFNHFLHLCGKSKNKQTQQMIDYWEKDFPKLTIVYEPKLVKIKERALDNIEYITTRLSNEDLIKLMNQCGVHLCCSQTEGYGHYIHEAKSCGSIIVTTSGLPMKVYIDSTMGFIIKAASKKPLNKFLGSKYIIDKEHFKQTIREIQNIDHKLLYKMGENSRSDYLRGCKLFDTNIKEVMTEIFNFNKTKTTQEDKMKKMMEIANNIDELPSVSIITPTYNRRHFFKLAVNNFMSFNYPKDKLEWIIVDDGIDKIKDIIENVPELKNDSRIKYFELDEKKTIGFKRNYCVEKASNDFIVCMDDDDYYPPNSVTIRVVELLNSGKDCVTCSAIGCFEINKYVSMVNIPPHKLPFSHRISEASLAFKKSFWEEQKFSETSTHSEAIEFLNGRENKTLEISWEGVLVALLHNRNTSTKIIIDQSPNGCYYGWSDELFLFITSLDKELTSEEKIAKANKKVKSVQFDEDDEHNLPTLS